MLLVGRPTVCMAYIPYFFLNIYFQHDQIPLRDYSIMPLYRTYLDESSAYSIVGICRPYWLNII